MDKYAGEELSTMSEFQWQHLGSSLILNKPIHKVRQLAQTIKEHNPDIIKLVEVGGEDSLVNFAKYFLDDNYHAFTKPGNSDRGIELGYLVKKKLNLETTLLSYRRYPINFLYPHELKTKKLTPKTSHRFSRDVLRLDLIKDEKTLIIFLLVHLKSKLDKKRIDPQGYLRREAELKTVLKIYKELRQKYNCPVILSGDFNGQAQLPEPDIEFSSIYSETNLKDALELTNFDSELRYSYLYRNIKQEYGGNQIDYVFLDPAISNLSLLDAKIDHQVEPFYWNDYEGMYKLMPLLPSDHLPYLFEIAINASQNKKNKSNED